MNIEKKLNKIIIISSPSGAGKTTICKKLIKNNKKSRFIYFLYNKTKKN